MARSLDAIMQELNAGYDPSRQLINSKLDALPGQAEAEISGLNATQTQAFGDILGGARDRGVGFGGIPLAEQAKYTANSFLPAVARVRSSQNDVKSSLMDSLNQTNITQQNAAQNIYQTELNRDAAAAEAEKQRQAAAAQQSSLYSALYGGAGGAGAAAAGITQATNTGINKADAAAAANIKALQSKGVLNDQKSILSDFTATAKSALLGNATDMAKIKLYAQIYPQYFSTPALKPVADLVVNSPTYTKGVLATPQGKLNMLNQLLTSGQVKAQFGGLGSWASF